MTPAAAPLPEVAELTLREKIAQLIVVRIGSNLPPVRRMEDDEERVARLLQACPVGGLMLLNAGPGSKAALDRLQAASRVPLLVAADIERGVGQQVRGYSLFPHAMAFDKLGDDAPAAVAQFAQVLAREARHAGIHITFGPVADVNTNPRNPIIATRAFSEDSSRAAELSRSYVAAAEAAGLLTTAKHFPGHGATDADSHHALPTVPRTLEELRACELPPFQTAIDAGCSLVMTAHVAYPAVDPTGLPATLSPIFLQRVLRDEMRFRGVVCSDSLLMAGVRHRFSTEEELALAALTAGVDWLLDVAEPERVVDFLCGCVEAGRLEVARVDQAVARVWSLKRRAFTEMASDGQPSAKALAERVARRAITVVAGHDALPLRTDAPLVAVLLKPFESPLDPPEQPLAAALREHFREVRYIQLGPASDAAAYETAHQLAADAEQLLIAVIVRPAAWHEFGLLAPQDELVRRLTRSRPAVLASLGVPYIFDDYPNASVQICTYSDVPVSQQALAAFLCTSDFRA